MEQSLLDTIRQWFDGYVPQFYDIDPDGLRNIMLKVEHTRKVCEITDALAVGEGLSQGDARIAGAVALLHDVGRFAQYRRWRTFRDSDSDNHARLAIEVIREQGVLDGLQPEERLLIEEAVRFHNLLEPPGQVQSPTRLFILLIRDADKLDIWRVFLDLYTLPEEERASAACLGLPDLVGFTPSCLRALAQKRIVRLEECRSVNDFKLLQISWALDLNFSTSYRLLLERGYIPRLEASLLGGRDEVDRSVLEIMMEVERRAKSHGEPDALGWTGRPVAAGGT
jgi:hypothetical protein